MQTSSYLKPVNNALERLRTFNHGVSITWADESGTTRTIYGIFHNMNINGMVVTAKILTYTQIPPNAKITITGYTYLWEITETRNYHANFWAVYTIQAQSSNPITQPTK